MTLKSDFQNKLLELIYLMSYLKNATTCRLLTHIYSQNHKKVWDEITIYKNKEGEKHWRVLLDEWMPFFEQIEYEFIIYFFYGVLFLYL